MEVPKLAARFPIGNMLLQSNHWLTYLWHELSWRNRDVLLGDDEGGCNDEDKPTRTLCATVDELLDAAPSLYDKRVMLLTHVAMSCCVSAPLEKVPVARTVRRTSPLLDLFLQLLTQHGLPIRITAGRGKNIKTLRSTKNIINIIIK